MGIAYASGRAGGIMTGVLSATNEKLLRCFLIKQWFLIGRLKKDDTVGMEETVGKKEFGGWAWWGLGKKHGEKGG
ncbi:hypothetical protein LguiB_030808 [Lonicera macranthoides]